jgi:hypothetical protein
VGIEVVQDDPDCFGFGVGMHDPLHRLGKIDLGAMLGDPGPTPASGRFAKEQNFGDAVAHLFGIFPDRLAGLHGLGFPYLPDQLTRRLVKTDDGVRRVIRFFINIEDVLHRRPIVATYLGNAPLLLLPGLEVVFL